MPSGARYFIHISTMRPGFLPTQTRNAAYVIVLAHLHGMDIISAHRRYKL
jgi:hypothetical protein